MDCREASLLEMMSGVYTIALVGVQLLALGAICEKPARVEVRT